MSRPRLLRVCLALFAIVAPGTASAQWIQQAIPLKPGWNAVFLEVDPEPASCDQQFAGLPVESVWDFNRTADLPQFVQDPSTLLPGSPDWLTWFPSQNPLASETRLSILRDGRAYLVKVAEDAAPLTWTVTGRPSLRRLAWQAGALNFVGFHVGSSGETFQDLFAGDSGLSGQPVLALGQGGSWQALVPARARGGEAYWIRCQQPSRRGSTVEIDAGSRLGLVFPAGVSERFLRIRNASDRQRRITVRLIPSAPPPPGQRPLAGPVPLERWVQDYAGAHVAWEPFKDPVVHPALPPGKEWNLRLGVRRAEVSDGGPDSLYQGCLEVTDDLGARWVVPISAEPIPASPAAAASGGPAPSAPAVSRTGLWVGEATLDAVSQPSHPSNASLPRTAGGTLSFRIVLHVDDDGIARLLQQVFVVRKPAIVEPDPDRPGFDRVLEPARNLVVTDESLLPGLVGPGEVAGRRLSSAAFALDEPLVLSGDPLGEGTLKGRTVLGHDHRLNPFKHVYHPDHNNLDERFSSKLGEGRESFAIARSIVLRFTQEDPLGLHPPGFGETELGGIYEETITGVHRSAIVVKGTFRIVRLVDVGGLNR